jgi:surface polysaccharide O-acyltransferase-like enzyme
MQNQQKVALPVDLIRNVAIILVVLLHATNEVLQSNANGSMYWWVGVVYKILAQSGVPLFVMLSGALLLRSQKFDEPIRVFLRKRINRIGVAFAFWTVVYIIWGFFVYHFPLTTENVSESVLRSLFTGAYYHFWFIYLIGGLYLITPILRVIIAYASDQILRYLLLLWFVGIAVLPIIELLTGYVLDNNVFLITGLVGYYVLGNYLQKIRIRRNVLIGLLVLAFIWTLFGVWLMDYSFASLGQDYFFVAPLTVNIIIWSVALFLLLMRAQPEWPSVKITFAKRLIQVISKNTLPIFFFHLIIMESFQRGFFGFVLRSTTLNPIVEIPLLAAITFFVTLALVLLMKRVPILNRLIG